MSLRKTQFLPQQHTYCMLLDGLVILLVVWICTYHLHTYNGNIRTTCKLTCLLIFLNIQMTSFPTAAALPSALPMIETDTASVDCTTEHTTKHQASASIVALSDKKRAKPACMLFLSTLKTPLTSISTPPPSPQGHIPQPLEFKCKIKRDSYLVGTRFPCR